MEYGISEQEKWARKSFGMCKHGFLLESYKKGEDARIAEEKAEIWASMSMRILNEALFKPPAQQPFRNDVIRAKVENKTNNVPFN